MAKDTPADRGGGTRIPRHDFVSKLVKDPSNLSEDEAMVVLNGWVGDSDEDGYTRLYCEPTLDCYADVRDEDILHHEDNPEVGAVVWAKRNAQVRYGRRGQGKRAASSFFSGQLLQDYRGGAQGGGGQGGGADGGGQNAQVSVLTCPPTSVPRCGVLPPSVGCPQGGGGGAEAAARVGQTGWYGCDPTAATMCFICPPITSDPVRCPVAAAPGGQSTAATLCTQIGCAHITIINPTAATHCFICPPYTSAPGCPSTSTCPPGGTIATVCTQIHCPGPVTYGPGCTLGFTCTYVGCPR
ncbi:MAG TPA: hypothetical protein VFS20_21975 [Longimicrobium sp.]|nr:hypothetical protein [Longimicrobium sp.]